MFNIFVLLFSWVCLACRSHITWDPDENISTFQLLFVLLACTHDAFTDQGFPLWNCLFRFMNCLERRNKRWVSNWNERQLSPFLSLLPLANELWRSEKVLQGKWAHFSLSCSLSLSLFSSLLSLLSSLSHSHFFAQRHKPWLREPHGREKETRNKKVFLPPCYFLIYSQLPPFGPGRKWFRPASKVKVEDLIS